MAENLPDMAQSIENMTDEDIEEVYKTIKIDLKIDLCIRNQ